MRGNYTPASRRTVQEFFDEWLAVVEQELKASTHVNYRDYAEAYVLPHIGKRALQDIDVPVLNELYRRLLTNGRRKPDTNTMMYQFWRSERDATREPTPAQIAERCGTSIYAARSAVLRYRRGRIPAPQNAGLAPKTVRNIHRMLHRAFRDAVAWRYVAFNPADHASLPRSSRSRVRPTPWTTDELRRWLQIAIQDRDAAMWILAATTGMRRSELAGARRDLLVLNEATLLIDPTRVVVAGHAQASDGNTKASRRRVSLDRFTVQALRAHLDRLDREHAAWGTVHHPAGPLFCHPDGRPLHPDTITRRFNRLVDRADVPRIRLHDVRHTYATLSIDAGIDPKKISDRIGHASVAFTLATYTHPSFGQDRQAAETFAAALFDSSASPDHAE
jgi:integrase